MLSRSILTRQLPTTIRTFTTTASPRGWKGSDPSEHITNSTDNLDVHSEAATAGREDRSKGKDGLAQSATESEARNSNERAKKDHPEAPGPVIGMNDERGGKGH
ncbi:MAG: hypothetical protein M1823_006117 [Watsoniomyces obsoletus]|nr:MAG: hypothetical protein M1823_006117 [Watsoniomyces obsoletus]